MTEQIEQPEPQQLVQWIKEFSETPFGRYTIATYQERRTELIRTAMYSAPTAEQKGLIIEHAAGVAEFTDWIDNYLYYAAHPEQLKKLLDQAKEDGETEEEETPPEQ